MTKLEAVRAGVGVLGGDIDAFLAACRAAAKKAPEKIGGQAVTAITYFWVRAKAWVARYMDGPDFREPLRDLTQSDSARYVYKSLKGHITLLLIFSAAINILYLAPSLFMMQVYDRVLPTSGLLTLVFLALVLLFAFCVMAVLDAQRSKILTRASMRVERLFGEPLLRMSLSGDKKREGNGIRDLDSVRGGLTSPAIVGFLDLPFMPIYIIACFMLHPILGALAIGGAAIILGVALANERASRKSLAEVSQTSVDFYASHDAYMRANSTAIASLSLAGAIGRRLCKRCICLRGEDHTLDFAIGLIGAWLLSGDRKTDLAGGHYCGVHFDCARLRSCGADCGRLASDWTGLDGVQISDRADGSGGGCARANAAACAVWWTESDRHERAGA
jgi:hypothetical protein